MAAKKFGTFGGVFTPTTLTILGVIMYIRHTWMVGNAGIIGAVGIILISVAITFTTALSLSSITTNTRIGSGGAFSLISQSLGLEIGGAIGIPFYFAQAIAVAMYVFGFREGLQTLLPAVEPLLLDLGIFVLVMAIAFISTSFAFKIQYVIFGIIVLSIVSILGALFIQPLHFDFQWRGRYPGSVEDGFGGSSFWEVFAVFFPAVTGVMAGANMSGDLKNPRVNIPVGTISAVIITTVVYLALVFVAALIATPDEMARNYNVFIDKAIYPPIVLAGLLGATLSSALGSFVGAPRILLALGEKNILPKSDLLAKLSRKGEPRNAMYVTAVIVLIGISLRNLNTIAPLLTMFFMVTYAMVNVVALIEQSLALPSYRPTLKIPIVVPIIGTFGSLAIMFIINPVVAMISIILIVFFYYYLVRKNIKSNAGDSRSGLFTALAEWATKKTTELSPKREVRSWRPDLLIPTILPKEIRSSFKLIQAIVYPKGSIKMLVLKNPDADERQRYREYLPNIVHKFKEIGVPISYTLLDYEEINKTINTSMQSLNAAFFKPNTVFMTIDPAHRDLNYYQRVLEDGRNNKYGVILYIPYSTASLAIEKEIGLWLSEIPTDWQDSFDIGNNDLATLLAVLIARNWDGTIDATLLHAPGGELDEAMLLTFRNMVRFTKKTKIASVSGSLQSQLSRHRNVDLNVISIPRDLKIEVMIDMVNGSRISAIFCSDSGFESAMV